MFWARCALALLLSLPCVACGEDFVADTAGSSNPSCADSRVRAAERFQAMPAQRRGWVGFRCAREM